MNNTVTDYLGNTIKEGDEICIIQHRTGNMFTNAKCGYFIPGTGEFKEVKMPHEPEKDCWIKSEYIKVQSLSGNLVYTTKSGKFTLTSPVSMLAYDIDRRHILAIKGVSDDNPHIK